MLDRQSEMCGRIHCLKAANAALVNRKYQLFTRRTHYMPQLKPSFIKKSFFDVLEDTAENISDFVKSPGKDMTRERDCTFVDTVLITCSFSAKRINTELFDFFSAKKSRIPSKSALTQQRNKLNDKLFPHIFHSFNKKVPFTKTYKGLHLIAIDGSDLNLPTCSTDHTYAIKQARSDGFYYQMHLNAAYDLLEKRYCGMEIQPRPQMNEGKAFRSLVNSYGNPGSALFIADRGYVSCNNIAFLLENRHHFLIRAKAPDSSASFLRHVVTEESPDDVDVCFYLTRSVKKHDKNPDKYKLLNCQREFLYIPHGDTESLYEMRFRVVRFSVGDGSVEYIVTDLSREAFPSGEIKKLYELRWGIETSFRSLKYALSLTFLHSVKRELIIQEVYAKLIAYNFSSLLHAYAEEWKHYKSCKGLVYKVSFEDVIPIALRFLIVRMSNDTIKALMTRHLTEIREDSHNPRRVRSQTANPLGNRA